MRLRTVHVKDRSESHRTGSEAFLGVIEGDTTMQSSNERMLPNP